MNKRKSSLLLSSIVLAGSTVVVAAASAPSASASPAQSQVTTVTLAAASAPNCVKRTVASNKRSVKVKNNCGIPVRINVKFKRSPDTGCYILWQDDSKKHSRPWPASYSGTSSCGAWP